MSWAATDPGEGAARKRAVAADPAALPAQAAMDGERQAGPAEAPARTGEGRRAGSYSWVQAGLGVVLAALCLAPFALVIAISFGQVVEGASWRWAFTPENYVRFFVGLEWPGSTSFLYLQKLWWTLVYAAVASAVAVSFAFPFTWLMTRQSRRAQTVWLVCLLASLSLSEVFVVMGWDVLFSNRSGLPMVFRETGLTDLLKEIGWFDVLRDWGMATPRDVRFKTSVFATVLTMSYLVFPYAVILLYPALSRLDNSMLEAARTMGARPMTVIRTVVLPSVKLPLLGALLLLFVYLLGAYVVVTVFADPAKQTLTITIYESVRGATLNAPFGAAQAVILLATAGAFLLASMRLARMQG